MRKILCCLALHLVLLQASTSLVLAQPSTTPQTTPMRDVLARAFEAPFLTDADIEMRFSDTTARVSSRGGPVLLRYDGITGATVNGASVPAQMLGANLMQVTLKPGASLVTVSNSKSPVAATNVVGQAAANVSVSSEAEWKARAATLKPGDELVVRDGHYRSWKLDIQAQGTAEKPIVIRPQTPGGVTFRRETQIVLRGQHIVFKGFRFENCGPNMVLQVREANDCRVTQCQFFGCGNSISTFTHIVEVDMNCHRNRVDNCYFTGSKSMSLAQRISANGIVGTNNRFDHNWFRDIYRYWINGQENIQLGQDQRAPTGLLRSQCIIENNLFDHAWGDGEIVSNKSSGNTIRWNLAAHCKRSAFTLRGGDEVLFEGNVMWNNGDGIRVMGRRHTIINNLIYEQPEWGIALETGHVDGKSNVASEASLIANNTIVNCDYGAIGGMTATEARPHLPTKNLFLNNILTGQSGILFDASRIADSTLRNNLWWATGSAQMGAREANALVAEPRWQNQGVHLKPAPGSPAIGRAEALPAVAHDRWNRLRDNKPDIGADEVSLDEAGGAKSIGLVEMPNLPVRPLLDTSLFRGSRLYRQVTARPMQGWQGDNLFSADAGAIVRDGNAILNTALPADFVLEWDYRPQSFVSTAQLQWGSSTPNDQNSFRISWGGVSGDSKPASVITLQQGSDIVADGADWLNYYLDYRYQPWLNTTRNSRTEPDPLLWYRFTLIKRAGKVLLMLGDARRPDVLPVLCWQSSGQNTPDQSTLSQTLRIGQTGAGLWRNFALHTLDYVGDKQPDQPQKLIAEASNRNRIALSWQATSPGAMFEIYRSEQPNFQPGSNNRIAITGNTFYNDFEAAPGTRPSYKVRAVTVSGMTSEFVAVTALPPVEREPKYFYQVLQAQEAKLQAPWSAERDNQSGRTFIWAPPGIGASMTGAPIEGEAASTFTLAKAGTYTLWGLVRTPNDGRDSFYTALDGQEFKDRPVGVHPNWNWSKIAGPVALEAGNHRLRLKHREPGAALAAILVTDDTTLVP